VAPVILVCSLAAVLLAGLMQRITGIGFALVASPVLIVAVGADEAVRLVIVSSLIATTYSLVQTRQQCRPGQVLPLLPFAVLAVWPAGLVAAAVHPSLSTLIAGIVVFTALAIALGPKGVPGRSVGAQAAVAGTLSGAMSAVAALGGPMAAAYGVGRKWGPSLVPNMQLFLLLTSVAVLLVRGWPATTQAWQLATLAAAAASGVWLGGQVATTIDARRAGMLTTAIAATGAAVAVFRGTLGLL
jgi:uncharacterized membrane protein YfcA